MQKLINKGVQYYTVDSQYEGQRIDNFLIRFLKGVPKTRIYRLLRKGEVRVNKKRVEASYRLQSEDSIRIPPVTQNETATPSKPTTSLTQLLKENILFEDKTLMILNKPPGIPVHGGSKVKIGIVEALRAMFPEFPHLELAHRLDADTSGCLVLAKKRSILKEVHQLLREGKVNKIYWALTRGSWKKSDLTVTAPLRKNLLSGGERIVKVDQEGKEALTYFKILEELPKSSLMEVTLMTGRTHQIRVHAQYRQHPLAGDEKYGDKEFNKWMRESSLKRLFLHAHSIEFTLPSTGQTIAVTAPLAVDLAACLDKLRILKKSSN